MIEEGLMRQRRTKVGENMMTCQGRGSLIELAAPPSSPPTLFPPSLPPTDHPPHACTVYITAGPVAG